MPVNNNKMLKQQQQQQQYHQKTKPKKIIIIFKSVADFVRAGTIVLGISHNMIVYSCPESNMSADVFWCDNKSD